VRAWCLSHTHKHKRARKHTHIYWTDTLGTPSDDCDSVRKLEGESASEERYEQEKRDSTRLECEAERER